MVKTRNNKIYINYWNDFNELSKEFKLHVYGKRKTSDTT